MLYVNPRIYAEQVELLERNKQIYEENTNVWRPECLMHNWRMGDLKWESINYMRGSLSCWWSLLFTFLIDLLRPREGPLGPRQTWPDLGSF